MTFEKSNNEVKSEITEFLKSFGSYNQGLWHNIKYLRDLPLKKQNEKRERNLNKPVAVFSRADRLRDGEGTECNIIFQSPGCAWAKSDAGGCTMCGYINDKAPESISSENLWNQFEYALDHEKTLLDDPANNVIFKMFTSGSFMDPKEIPKDIQLNILKRLIEFPSIKEIVVESRPEYITETVLAQYRSIIQTQYFEVGVGVESTDEFIRLNLINKGFTWSQIMNAKELLHSFGFGIKAYLLFKPPFLSEYAAIKDLIQSIQTCAANEFDTISINPTNIQMHTLCEELFNDQKFRSPWFYSLLWVLKHTLTPEILTRMRVISDPSAAGLERGIHNCRDKTCNHKYLDILKTFVLTQDLELIPENFEEECWESYKTQLLLT